MWRPGFTHDRAVHAVLAGAHRSLCVYSYIYRGTRQHPGLVLGLDYGGRCEGIAFHVPAARANAVLGCLRRREQITNVYHAVYRQVTLLPYHREVRALCYMVDRHHRQYAGSLPLEEQARLVRRARGRLGVNADYVRNTVAHLRECGVTDRALESLMLRLGRYGRTRGSAG